MQNTAFMQNIGENISILNHTREKKLTKQQWTDLLIKSSEL